MGADLRLTGESILKNKDLRNLNKNEFTILNLFRYMKNYQGNLQRHGKLLMIIDFQMNENGVIYLLIRISIYYILMKTIKLENKGIMLTKK